MRARTRMRLTGSWRTVRPLVHVVAGLELAGERLGQDVDAREPLDRRDGVPVRHDQSERGAVVAARAARRSSRRR